MSFIPGLPPQRNQPSLRHHFAPAVPLNPSAPGGHSGISSVEAPLVPQLVEDEKAPVFHLEQKPPKDAPSTPQGKSSDAAQGFQFSWSQGGQRGFEGQSGAGFRQMQERDLERYGRHRKPKERSQGGQDSSQDRARKQPGQDSNSSEPVIDDCSPQVVLVADEPGYGLLFGQKPLLEMGNSEAYNTPFGSVEAGEGNFASNDVLIQRPIELEELPEPWSLLIPEPELRCLAKPLVQSFDGLPETMLWSCYHAGVRFELSAQSGYQQSSRRIALDASAFFSDLPLRLLCQAFDHFLGNEQYASQASLAVLAAKPPEIDAQKFFIDQILARRTSDGGPLAEYLDYLFLSLVQKKPEPEWLLHEG